MLGRTEHGVRAAQPVSFVKVVVVGGIFIAEAVNVTIRSGYRNDSMRVTERLDPPRSGQKK